MGTHGRTPWGRRVLAVLFFFLLPAPVILLLIFRFVPIPGDTGDAARSRDAPAGTLFVAEL